MTFFPVGGFYLGRTNLLQVSLLAGGKSSRMGSDKLFLPYQNQPIIQYMVNKLKNSGFSVLIIGNSNNQEKIHNNLIRNEVPVYQDLIPDKGPMGGIYSSLSYSPDPYVFVMAVDLLLFVPALIRYLEKFILYYDIVVPKTQKGYEPLFAIYKQTCTSVILKMILENDLKISNCFEKVVVKEVGFDEIKHLDPFLKSFRNINTKEDYEEIIRKE